MKTLFAAVVVMAVFLGATMVEAKTITCIDLGGGIKKCGDVTIIDL